MNFNCFTQLFGGRDNHSVFLISLLSLLLFLCVFQVYFYLVEGC